MQYQKNKAYTIPHPAHTLRCQPRWSISVFQKKQNVVRPVTFRKHNSLFSFICPSLKHLSLEWLPFWWLTNPFSNHLENGFPKQGRVWILTPAASCSNTDPLLLFVNHFRDSVCKHNCAKTLLWVYRSVYSFFCTISEKQYQCSLIH